MKYIGKQKKSAGTHQAIKSAIGDASPEKPPPTGARNSIHVNNDINITAYK